MSQGGILLIISPLSFDGFIEHVLSHAALGLDSIMNLAEDTVEDSWDTAEECGL